MQYRNGYKGKKTDSTVNIADKETLTQLMASYGTHDYRAGFNTMRTVNQTESAAAGEDDD
ncbi:MAG: hypothetical protein Q9N62_09990 [Ghiorsea sp.]|nr:hypothetical protein [Ghiorsea sp.]